MAITKPTIGQANWGPTLNAALDAVDQRLIALETVVDEFVALPSFLTYAEGRNHLPVLNSNFGWDSVGVWFGPTATTSGDERSYPIFTNFTIPTNSKVEVGFDVEIDSFCSDAGVCIYVNGTVPIWNFGPNLTRIAAQFNCPNGSIEGREATSSAESSVPAAGTYRMVLTYDPEAVTDNVRFRLLTTGNSPETVFSVTLTETLPTGAYRVGFAADMDSGEGDGGDTRTYISNLSISINNGTTLYENTLQEGNSGAAPSNDLVVPVDIKDTDGSTLLRFEKSNTGTTRIDALQDDLALRSSNDILLYPGDDGPGKVYIGWGNDATNSSPQNEVATKGYVDRVSNPIPARDGNPIVASNVTDITAALSDAGKFIYITSDENHYWQDYIVPPDSTLEFPLGTVITFVLVDATVRVLESYDSNTDTYSRVYGEGQGTTTNYMYFSGTGVVRLIKINVNEWILAGNNILVD